MDMRSLSSDAAFLAEMVYTFWFSNVWCDWGGEGAGEWTLNAAMIYDIR